MNFVGAFMWVAVGGTALHYWNGYLADHDFLHVATERQVKKMFFSIKLLKWERPPFYYYYTNNLFSFYRLAWHWVHCV